MIQRLVHDEQVSALFGEKATTAATKLFKVGTDEQLYNGIYLLDYLTPCSLLLSPMG